MTSQRGGLLSYKYREHAQTQELANLRRVRNLEEICFDEVRKADQTLIPQPRVGRSKWKEVKATDFQPFHGRTIPAQKSSRKLYQDAKIATARRKRRPIESQFSTPTRKTAPPNTKPVLPADQPNLARSYAGPSDRRPDQRTPSSRRKSSTDAGAAYGDPTLAIAREAERRVSGPKDAGRQGAGGWGPGATGERAAGSSEQPRAPA